MSLLPIDGCSRERLQHEGHEARSPRYNQLAPIRDSAQSTPIVMDVATFRTGPFALIPPFFVVEFGEPLYGNESHISAPSSVYPPGLRDSAIVAKQVELARG